MKMMYVVCKNSPEDNRELHNMKNYHVVHYDDQPYGIGRVTVELPSGREVTYRKSMFTEPKSIFVESTIKTMSQMYFGKI